jgi:ribose-phosphate pyrophosphokinase
MISVNERKLDCSTFPDGTCSFRFAPNPIYAQSLHPSYRIDWLYESDLECMQLWHLVHHLRAVSRDSKIVLVMPYIPNARMDRVKNVDEVFTLKSFAEFINALNFNTVYVLDPHSNVASALIDRIFLIDVSRYIYWVIEWAEERGLNPLLCYPDEGSAKRYGDLHMDYVTCIKHRDWRTGEIERTELISPEKVVGRNVLIVDDICSRGGTFAYTAKVLKEAGANEIDLYVTHCENAIQDGPLLTDDLISHIFTTNSILRVENEKITVVEPKF